MKKRLIRWLSIPVLLLAGSAIAQPLPTRADTPAINFGACSSSQTPTVLSTPGFTLEGVTTNVGIAPTASGAPMLMVTGAVATTTSTAASYGFVNGMRGLWPVDQSGYRDHLDQGLFTFSSTTTLTQTTIGTFISTTIRTGTFSINLSTTGSGHFYSPASFSSGMPVLTGTIGEQILPNADGQSFTTISQVTITSVTPFSLNGTCYQLGAVGQTFAIEGSGQLAGPQSQVVGFTAATT
jgi:hypothetical protein